MLRGRTEDLRLYQRRDEQTDQWARTFHISTLISPTLLPPPGQRVVNDEGDPYESPDGRKDTDGDRGGLVGGERGRRRVSLSRHGESESGSGIGFK